MFCNSACVVLCACWTLLLLANVSCHPGHQHHNHKEEKTIIFLVDGVRFDYISRDPTLKGFPRLAKNGAMAEYVTPIFPSNSYPNWYSIVTGLYAENHGFVQNYMYDVGKEEFFLMAPEDNASNEHWWNKTEPIWVTAEKKGLKTAMQWWDGCQVSINGVKPTVCTNYQSYWTWPTVIEDTEEALGDILTWFDTSRDHRLALIYYEGVDAIGHYRGPNSEHVKKNLQDIDGVIDRFQDKIIERKMDKQVNFLVVSDHGMANSDPKTVNIINLEEYNVTQDIELMLDRGSLTMILPIEGREEKLYRKLKNANLKGVHVYKKEDIPEKLHFKNNDLVLPILLVADEGFFINKITDTAKMRPNYSRIFKGYHGYDPDKAQNMRTIFYAIGPSIRKGYVSPPIKMVDHYNLICHLLNVEAQPNNGSWDRVSGFVGLGETGALQADAAGSLSRDGSNGAPGFSHLTLTNPLFWISQMVALLALKAPQLQL